MAECSINEVSRLMQHSHQVLNQMKRLSLKSELTPDDIAWFTQNKQTLSPVLAKLKRWSPSLVGKIRQRQAKRRRQKMIRIRRKREKEKALAREREIDDWMKAMKREEEKKEKTAQQTRSIQDKMALVERHLSLLSGLEKLAKARGATIEPTTPRLQDELGQLRERVKIQNRDEREVRRYLFNDESSPDRLDPEALLKIRNDWDQFVSTEAVASSIPIGWVAPVSSCDHCKAVANEV